MKKGKNMSKPTNISSQVEAFLANGGKIKVCRPQARISALNLLNKYGMKGTIGVRDHMALVVRIKKGKLDLAFDSANGELHYQVNPYWTDKNFTGKSKAFFAELIAAMKGDKWYDRSDIMTDYFDTAYYIDIQAGDYSVPYETI